MLKFGQRSNAVVGGHEAVVGKLFSLAAWQPVPMSEACCAKTLSINVEARRQAVALWGKPPPLKGTSMSLFRPQFSYLGT